jgi:hypothetical protein
VNEFEKREENPDGKGAFSFISNAEIVLENIYVRLLRTIRENSEKTVNGKDFCLPVL